MLGVSPLPVDLASCSVAAIGARVGDTMATRPWTCGSAYWWHTAGLVIEQTSDSQIQARISTRRDGRAVDGGGLEN